MCAATTCTWLQAWPRHALTHVVAGAAPRLRFGNPTDDFVGLNSAPYKQPVHVQLSLFKNRQHGVAPLKNGHVLAILEQLTLCRCVACSAVLVQCSTVCD
jgi:hypothetical protein